MGREALSFPIESQVGNGLCLRLIETTDLHVHLHPYDYYADRPNPDLGLSRLSELVDKARAEVPNCLLFDNGDFLQGTPVGDYFAYDRDFREGDLHPLIAAMNTMRYDAITLGNHEFNYGLDFLTKTMSGARFPVVSANLARNPRVFDRADQMYVSPYSLLRRKLVDPAGQVHDICIGVLGLLPPQVVNWERQHLEGRLWTCDMVRAARTWVPQMREAGADLVVVLAHSGIGASRYQEGAENAAIPLARVEGIDALFLGHSHQLFPCPGAIAQPGLDPQQGLIEGKPAVMSGFFGSHLGIIDLFLEHRPEGWKIASSHSQVRALRDAHRRFNPPLPSRKAAGKRPPEPASPAVRRILGQAHDAVLGSIRAPIGQTKRPINSFFTHLGVSGASSLVACAQLDYMRAPLAAAGLADLPVLSAVASAKGGGLSGPRNFTDIPAGPVLLRNIADLYVFPNTIAALRLTGQQIALWLERSAAAFNVITPGVKDQLLVNPESASYNFEIVYGLKYRIDLSAPPRFAPDGTEIDAGRSRICDLTYMGQPLDPMAEFMLCTNSFRAQSLVGFAGTGRQDNLIMTKAVIRDVLRDFCHSLDVVNIPATSPFSFCEMPGTSLILRTAPDAHAHLDLIARYAPEIAGVNDQGFLRVRLSV